MSMSQPASESAEELEACDTKDRYRYAGAWHQRVAGEADRIYIRAKIGPKASGNGP